MSGHESHIVMSRKSQKINLNVKHVNPPFNCQGVYTPFRIILVTMFNVPYHNIRVIAFWDIAEGIRTSAIRQFGHVLSFRVVLFLMSRFGSFISVLSPL